MTGIGKVNDRKPSVTQANVPFNTETFTIWSPMRQRSGHPFEDSPVYPAPIQLDDPRDSTHDRT